MEHDVRHNSRSLRKNSQLYYNLFVGKIEVINSDSLMQ
jgi:hypothetical protein